MKKTLLLLLILAQSFSSCEKDDICDANTPTTPRLIITFYDNDNRLNLKNVTDLGIIGDGLSKGILFSGVSKIQVPLILTEDATKYSFILNSKSTDLNLIYTDSIAFNYSRETVYVSRACGFKTLFNLNNDITLPNAFVLNKDPKITNGQWIKDISIEKYNLETENETHIKIFF